MPDRVEGDSIMSTKKELQDLIEAVLKKYAYIIAGWIVNEMKNNGSNSSRKMR